MAKIEVDLDIPASELSIESIDNIQPDEQEPDADSKIQNVFAKFMEEKHCITYRKLVVPQSMRSIYWKFFGFPADDNGEILTRVKIVCLLCKTQIAYNRNTSNLRMHLQNKHLQELHDLEAVSPPRKQIITPESKEKRAQKRMLKAAMASSGQHIYTTNVDGTVHVGTDIQLVTDSTFVFPEQEEDISVNVGGKPLKFMIKSPMDNVTTTTNQNVFVLADEHVQQSSSSSKPVSEAIIEYLIMELQLPDIVQEQGFQRLVATLKSPCQIPSKNSLEEDIIPRTYTDFRETIYSNISLLTGAMSLSIEQWISNCGEEFFTFLIYYQSPCEISLETKMLCTIHGPQEWEEEQWERTINIIIDEWNLDIKRITAVVLSTNRVELTNALRNKQLPVIPCLLNSLQVCAQACFDNPQVSRILAKCRAIIGAIVSNSNATCQLQLQEQLLGYDENVMAMDCPSLWTTTYTMLHQMLLRREFICTLLNSFEHVCAKLEDDEWQVISDLVDVLEPFKITIMTLSEEKMPLISLLKPLLWQLISAHLKVKGPDSATARSLKESFSEMLCDRYSDPDVTLLLRIATTLDPRFKEVPYATDEVKNLVSIPLKDKLIELMAEDEETVDARNEETMSPSKKSRVSGMELLLGGLRATKRGMTSSERADLELAQYQSEGTAALDICPLQWWAKASVKCPNLGKIASRYNCVPVCCQPPSRIPVEVQMVYNAKRAALPPHLVDKLLFLHANHNLV